MKREEATRSGGLLLRHLGLGGALAAAAIAGALAAGCGGDERSSRGEYEQTVQAAYGNVRDAFRAAGRARSLPALARRIEVARNELEESADDLDDVQPPRELGELHQELILGMRGYASDLAELQQNVEAGNTQAIARFNRRVATNPSVLRMAEAAEEMIHRGYDLGALDPEG